MNQLFPIFLKLEEKRLLIVGGGNVSREKLTALLGNTPDVNILLVAPEISPEIEALVRAKPNVTIKRRIFLVEDLDDTDIVFVASNDPQTNAEIKQAANGRGLLVNVADTPMLCDFYLGSIVQKADLKIAISTNGKSPTIAKRLKEVLDEAIPKDMDELLRNFSTLRSRLSGDFSEKVRLLNSLSRVLVDREGSSERKAEKFWKKSAYICIGALALLFIGNAAAKYIRVEELPELIRLGVASLPSNFYLMLLTGFLAQIIDGLLGMGYGVICTSVLLAFGVPLPAISGGIHTAEMFSSASSGFSHYKFGNVNKRLFRIIVIPGVVGACLGAFILSKWGIRCAVYFRPLLATYTLLLGLRILWIAFRGEQIRKKVRRVGWLGFAGGFLDSIGGGGWGPLVTSTLIAKGRTPRFVVGTVSLSEFFITFASAITFFIMLGVFHWQIVTGLIVGGVAAAPVAARLSGRLPRKAGLIALGVLIVSWSLIVIVKLF